MAVANVDAKDWSTWLTSADGFRYGNYPDGDKPFGFATVPTLLRTSHRSISLVNNYNGKGGWFQLAGRALGAVADLGTDDGARVYLRDPLGDNAWHEVFSYLSMTTGFCGAKLGFAIIEMQIGTLGGSITPGRALDIKATVNGTDTNILTGWIISQPGHFYFVDPAAANDTSGVVDDPTHPFKHPQNYAGGGVFTANTLWRVLANGDTVVFRTGTYTSQLGYDGRFMRLSGVGAAGSVPNGTIGHGALTFYVYPGESMQANFPTGGGFHGVESSFAAQGKGSYVQISGMNIQIGASANRDAAPINLQSGGDHWVVFNNKLGPWPSTVTGVNSAKAGSITGQGSSSEFFGNECFECASTSSENHGIYLGGQGSTGDAYVGISSNNYVGYNWCHDNVGGSSIQFYWQGGNNLFFQNNTIECNYCERPLKYGINLNQSFVSGTVTNNIVAHCGLNALTLAPPNQALNILIECNTFFDWNTTGSINDGGVTNAGFVTSGTCKINHNIFALAQSRSTSASWVSDTGAGHSAMTMSQNIWYDYKRLLMGKPSEDNTDGITTSPDFTSPGPDPNAEDLTRQSGADITTAQAVTVDVDIFGVARPQGAHKWIGATEGVGT